LQGRGHGFRHDGHAGEADDEVKRIAENSVRFFSLNE
jgi:hypothetical protein